MFNHNNFDDILADRYAWSIWHDEGLYSVQYMNDKELSEAILEDILQVTFYEKNNNVKVSFSYDTLVRNINIEEDLKRIKRIYDSKDVMEFITIHYPGEIRITENRDVQQKAMDKIGAWMEGFEPPEGVTVIHCNTEVLEEKIEQH